MCSTCQVYLCFTSSRDCFSQWHSSLNPWLQQPWKLHWFLYSLLWTCALVCIFKFFSDQVLALCSCWFLFCSYSFFLLAEKTSLLGGFASHSITGEITHHSTRHTFYYGLTEQLSSIQEMHLHHHLSKIQHSSILGNSSKQQWSDICGRRNTADNEAASTHALQRSKTTWQLCQEKNTILACRDKRTRCYQLQQTVQRYSKLNSNKKLGCWHCRLSHWVLTRHRCHPLTMILNKRPDGSFSMHSAAISVNYHQAMYALPMIPSSHHRCWLKFQYACIFPDYWRNPCYHLANWSNLLWRTPGQNIRTTFMFAVMELCHQWHRQQLCWYLLGRWLSVLF